MRRMEHRTRAAGFTLVELLVVICIITLLMGLTVVGITGILNRVRATRTASFVRVLHTACEDYRGMFQVYPPAQPYRESANLHYYLGSRWTQVHAEGPDRLTQERDPIYTGFRSSHLVDGAPNVYPDPPSELIDGWGQTLHYRNPGSRGGRGVDIWSDGRNTKTDEDDLGNWPEE